MQMRSGLKLFVAAAAVAVLCAPAPARADGFVSPWAAVQFGGKITNAGRSIDNGRAAVGVTAGGMGAGIIGGEVDFGYSPRFFGSQNDFAHTTAADLMA